MGNYRENGRGGSRVEALAARRRLFKDMPVEERTVDIAGVATTFLEGGEGPPVILLHGQGGSAVAWIPIIARLAQTHRLVVPDLPGLGESAAIDDDVDGQRVAAWLEELITKTCDTPPVVTGASLGGSIAAHFAINSHIQSRQIVFVSSGSLAPFRPDPRLIPSLIRVSVRPTERNIERFFKHTVVDLPAFKARLGNKWDDFIAYGRERNSNPRVQAANRELLRKIGTKQIPKPDLAGIDRKVALIWGRQDKVMKVKIAEAASRDFGWPLSVIESCGHAAAWDQPDTFADILEDVMRS